MYKHCPACGSKDVILYERSDLDCSCLLCTFVWRQTDKKLIVSIEMLREVRRIRQLGRRSPPATA